MSPKPHRLCPFLLVGFLVGTPPVVATDLPKVEVDLGSRRFNDNLPFDVPFVITGTAPDGVNEIAMYYCPVVLDEKRQNPQNDYFTNPTVEHERGHQPTCEEVGFGLLRPVRWVRRQAKTFALEVPNGRLYPHHEYQFTFELIYRAASLDDADKLQEKLDKFLREQLQNRFADGFLSRDELSAIEDDLNERWRSTLASRLEVSEEDLEGVGIGLNECPFVETTDALLQANLDRNDALRAINGGAGPNPTKGSLESVRRSMCVDGHDTCLGASILKVLRSLEEDPSVLSDQALRRWNGPLDPASPAHRTVTMKSLASLLADAIEWRVGVRDLLAGTSRLDLDSGTLAASTKLDSASLSLIATFFEFLSNPSFTQDNGMPIVATELAAAIQDDILEELQNITRNLARISEADQAISRIQSEFPRFVASTVVNVDILISSKATEITEGKHQYIGLDLGIGYAEQLDSPITYYAASFYFVSVNKDSRTPMTLFRGRDRFLKRLSLLAGLTLSGVEGGDIEDLFSGGSVVIGAGFRLTRSIRLNAGYLLFEQKDPNPLISETDTELDAFVSISLDVDLVDMLGALGKRILK